MRLSHTVRANLQKVANLMADATGDEDWVTVDLEGLHSWVSAELDPNYTDSVRAEISKAVSELLDMSVEPHHVNPR